MEEPLEQERSMTSDELKPSSSSTTSKSTRSNKQTNNGKKSRHKRRRPANSARSSSDHSSSSSRSSSSSSTRSSQSSVKPCPSNEQQNKKTRSVLAQEHLQTVVEKTKTGQIDIIDGFAFLSFEIDDDWRTAFEHFQQQQIQKTLTNKRISHISTRRNGHVTEQNDGHSINRSISVPCKTEESQKTLSMPMSAPVEESTTENSRAPMWPNRSPTKSATENQSSATIKIEPTDRTSRSNRTTSETDDTSNNQHSVSSPRTNGSLQKPNDDKSDNHKKEHNNHHHHHHHSHHQHKLHKRHKTKHDLSINGDSSEKHPTITSMSDFAKQQIKKEPMPLPPSFPFSNHLDPKLFPLSSFPPFAPPAGPHSVPTSYHNPYDPSLMLAGRLYGGPYPRDLPQMPPTPMHTNRPPSRSVVNPFSIKENHPESATSMEKVFEKLYPSVLPGYFTAAASAAASAAAASTNSNSSVSSLSVKMHGASPNGPDHSLWSQRDAYQRQYLNSSGKHSSSKPQMFDTNAKLTQNNPSNSPVDRHHSSSSSTNDLPNTNSAPTGQPFYLGPVIFTEFHQHQHNHNHTHEHKLNITTKEERQSSTSPIRSRTPSSSEAKKMKSSFSVTDMVIEKSTNIKHSPQSNQAQQLGFHSVNNKKESITPNGSPLSTYKKFNGKWSTAHIHIAWMIHHYEQRQREKSNSLHSLGKVRPTPGPLPIGTMPPPPPPPPLSLLPPPPIPLATSATSSSSSSTTPTTLLPPPLPLLDSTSDLGLLRPPPMGFPFDMNMSQNNIFRPPSSTMKLPRPIVTSTPSSSSSSSSSSTNLKPPNIKREQKTPFPDDRMRRNSPQPPPVPLPLSRSSSSSSNFPPLSPSQRMRMEFPPFMLASTPPTGTQSIPSHPFSSFPHSDDRKRFGVSNADLLPPFSSAPGSSPFLSQLFPMGAPTIPSLPMSTPSLSLSSSSSMPRRNGSVHSLSNSDLSKPTLFPIGPGQNPFDFGRPPFLPPGAFPMSNNPFESDRYRFMLEQQARERELQYALMAATAGGSSQAPGSLPPPSFFTDPTSSPLFKHY